MSDTGNGRADVAALGIDVVADLPVGRRLQDQPFYYSAYALEHRARRLQSQLEALGYAVILDRVDQPQQNTPPDPGQPNRAPADQASARTTLPKCCRQRGDSQSASRRSDSVDNIKQLMA